VVSTRHPRDTTAKATDATTREWVKNQMLSRKCSSGEPSHNIGAFFNTIDPTGTFVTKWNALRRYSMSGRAVVSSLDLQVLRQFRSTVKIDESRFDRV
jgi:hypothetical protein